MLRRTGKTKLVGEKIQNANQLKARIEGEIKGLNEDIEREKGKIEIVKKELEALEAPAAPPAGGGGAEQPKSSFSSLSASLGNLFGWRKGGGRKQKTISKNKKKKKNITKRKY
jgi:hypothetical protein